MIKIIGTGSKGNCYLIDISGDKLLLECGVPWKQIQEALQFDYRNVSCLLTHSHKDHSKEAKKLVQNGIRLIAAKETLEELGLEKHYRTTITTDSLLPIGNFIVKTLPGVHTNNDNSNCIVNTYLITHKPTGIKILFITDSFYVDYTLKNSVDYMLVEANYSEKNIEDIPEEKLRVLQSHMSLETAREFISKCNTKDTKEICLIHSTSGTDEIEFIKTIQEVTEAKVTLGKNGDIIY